MSTVISLNAYQVVSGAGNLTTSGESITETAATLSSGTHPICGLDAACPAGTDTVGTNFTKWYDDCKQAFVEQCAALGLHVTSLGSNTGRALAGLLQVDEENAATIEDLIELDT